MDRFVIRRRNSFTVHEWLWQSILAYTSLAGEGVLETQTVPHPHSHLADLETVCRGDTLESRVSVQSERPPTTCDANCLWDAQSQE